MANATSAVRITPRQDNSRSIPVYIADGYTCYNGTVLTIASDGYARPATGTNNGTAIAGILAPKDDTLINKGAVVGASSGPAVATDVVVGVFDLPQDGSIVQANVGGNVYLLNDHEVSTTTTSGITVPCLALNSDGTVQVSIEWGGEAP